MPQVIEISDIIVRLVIAGVIAVVVYYMIKN